MATTLHKTVLKASTVKLIQTVNGYKVSYSGFYREFVDISAAKDYYQDVIKINLKHEISTF
ncbi:hypothetical protein [Salmonella phage NINP13076]|uniref:KTSC domain-containing protein n=1 Tax=Salmonella phage SalP219 TaxID=3158864 RepID=A0AAU7PIS2_9CAUD|nr:hypothetical protein [Salmonella phage NINP13076]